MLASAGLSPIGIFFPNAEADRKARAVYRDADGGALLKRDPHQTNLAHWHALEERNPDLFGRMHVLYCCRK